MRVARNTVPGRAGLTASACVSIMPSESLSEPMALFQVLFAGEAQQVRIAAVPCVAAVERAQHAADLEPRIDLVRRARGPPPCG